MSDPTKLHLSKVVVDDDNNTVMLFPQELLDALSLVPNEILQWDIRSDGIYIKRTKLVDTKAI